MRRLLARGGPQDMHLARRIAVVDKDRLAHPLAERLNTYTATPRKRIAKGGVLIQHAELAEKLHETGPYAVSWECEQRVYRSTQLLC